jgi:hypothetical protein
LRNAPPNDDDREDLTIQLSRRDAFWLTSQIQPEYAEIQRRLFGQAQGMGLVPKLVREFREPNGKPIYWVYRFHPVDERPWRKTRANGGGALDAEIELPEGIRDVRFRLPARRWSRALTVAVEFQDRGGKRLAAWWRSAEYFQFPRPDQRFAFGSGLHPDYFVPLPGGGEGSPARLIVHVESKQNRAVDFRVEDLEVR